MIKTIKSKIEKNTEYPSSDEEDIIDVVVIDECFDESIDESINESIDELEPVIIIKEKKKIRTQKQIDATNNMRLKLNEKRDIVKQEKDEFKKQIKIKIKKDKIQKKVISKLKEIIDEDESDDEEIPVKKIIVKEPLKNMIKFF